MPSAACASTRAGQRDGREPDAGIAVPRASAPDVPERGEHQRVGDEAMVELHGHRVLEQVQIPGLHGAEAVRDEPAVHQRPGVVGGARLQAGDERAEQDLHEHEQHDRRRAARAAGRAAARGLPRSSSDSATQMQRAEDQDREAQMQRQPVLADVDAVGEAGAHHVPADRALQRRRARRCRRAWPQQRARNLSRGQEIRGTARRKATPIRRPRKRCVHSHQKMALNASRLMPLLTCWYCGICWYLANASSQSACDSGGHACRRSAAIR